MAKIKRNPVAEKVADLIIENYVLKNGKDIQDALKEFFGSIFEKFLNAKMDAHLGYEKNSQNDKNIENRPNGYTSKIYKELLAKLNYSAKETEKVLLSL